MSTPASPPCFYCHRPADPVTGCWIARGAMAHESCAWAVNDDFFFELDAGKSEATNEHP
jgi:hypothetical protein